MNNKLILLPITFAILALTGCSSDEDPFTGSGGSSSGAISDKNFNLFFNPVNPAVVDDDGFHGGVEVEVVVFAGDKFNTSVSGGTVFIKTEWGILSANSCQIANGSCSVTWTSDSDFGFIPADFSNTFTAYTIGEESYVDLNGSGNFDDADVTYLRDLDEPFLDINHDGVYTLATDEVIDIDESGDHTAGDSRFNGAGCTHSLLCANETTMTIYDIGTIPLNESLTPPVLTVNITSPTPASIFAVGSNITFTASVTDPEDGTILGQDNPIIGNNITWSSNIDNSIGPQSNTFVINTLSAGSHTITVTAIDSDANTVTNTVDIVVTDNAPVVTINTPTTGSNITTATLTNFTATITDNEDGLITTGITWSSDIDNTLTGTSNNITSAELVTLGAHVITASVTDSDGNTSTDTVNVTIQ